MDKHSSLFTAQSVQKYEKHFSLFGRIVPTLRVRHFEMLSAQVGSCLTVKYYNSQKNLAMEKHSSLFTPQLLQKNFKNTLAYLALWCLHLE